MPAKVRAPLHVGAAVRDLALFTCDSWQRNTCDEQWTFGFNLVVGALTFTEKLPVSPLTRTSLLSAPASSVMRRSITHANDAAQCLRGFSEGRRSSESGCC